MKALHCEMINLTIHDKNVHILERTDRIRKKQTGSERNRQDQKETAVIDRIICLI